MGTTDLNIKGRVGDITFYKRDGKTIIRLNEGIARSRIKRGKEFAINRKHRKEFTACKQTANCIYIAFNKLLIEISLRYKVTEKNLLKLLRLIQLETGTQILGKRTIQISDLLSNYKFIGDFDNTVNFSYLDEISNNSFAVTIPKFNATNSVTAPEGATHFKLIFSMIIMKATTYNELTKNYNNITAKEKQTQYGELQNITGQTEIQVFSFHFNINSGEALIIAVGIAFYNNDINMYLGNASKIFNVYNY